jgi:hypothetical protein
MFVQVLQGKVSDRSAIHARFDDWVEQLGPDAEGWLGSTEGTTDDGEFVAVVRFRDEDAARTNSDRPEQGTWWGDTEKLFADEVEFHDYPNVTMMSEGGSDDAGFVQIIQGVYTGDKDPGDMDFDDPRMAELRPEVIGGVLAWDDAGHFTQAVYFTSEEAARHGERKLAAEPELSAKMNEWVADVEGLTYLDLRAPRMASP